MSAVPHEESPHKGKTGLQRLLNAMRYSLEGLAAAVRHEDAFRLELAIFVIAAPIGLWLGRTGLERALLIGCLFLVLIVELLNSAVMLSLVNAAVVWLLILLS